MTRTELDNSAIMPDGSLATVQTLWPVMSGDTMIAARASLLTTFALPAPRGMHGLVVARSDSEYPIAHLRFTTTIECGKPRWTFTRWEMNTEAVR